VREGKKTTKLSSLPLSSSFSSLFRQIFSSVEKEKEKSSPPLHHFQSVIAHPMSTVFSSLKERRRERWITSREKKKNLVKGEQGI